MPGPHDRFDSARSVCGNTRSQRLVDAASVKAKISSFHKRAGRNAGPFCLSSSFQKGLIDRFRRSVIPLSRKIMSLRSFAICTAPLFVSSVCAIAGSAGGGAQIAPNDNSSVSTYKVTDTSVGASARDSAGASTSQLNGSSSTNASSTDTSSSNGAASSSGTASSNGGTSSNFGVGPSGAKSANATATAIEIAREKVIDTGDKAVETEKPAKAGPSDKTFAPGLLDKVNDISAVGAQKEHSSASKANESKSAASENKNDSHK